MGGEVSFVIVLPRILFRAKKTHVFAKVGQAAQASWIGSCSDLNDTRHGRRFAFSVVDDKTCYPILQSKSLVLPPICLALNGRR